jgi:hypothetical protein
MQSRLMDVETQLKELDAEQREQLAELAKFAPPLTHHRNYQICPRYFGDRS